jgi:hypothetical protein
MTGRRRRNIRESKPPSQGDIGGKLPEFLESTVVHERNLLDEFEQASS